MANRPLERLLTGTAQAIDPPNLDRHFGGADGLLPLWIAALALPVFRIDTVGVVLCAHRPVSGACAAHIGRVSG